MQKIGTMLDDRHSYPQERKKEAKKERIQKPIGIWHMEGSTQLANVNPIDKSQKEGILDPDRNLLARKNAEIDDFIRILVLDGMIDVNFTAWHAKCIHLLGMQEYNQILIQARGADANKPPQLFAFKLKGALQLQAKREFYRQQ